MMMNEGYPLHFRMRRLRRTSAIRDMLCESFVRIDDLIMPIFVKANLSRPEAIDSMPGIFRHSPSQAMEECRLLSDLGIKAVALFPCVDPIFKDPIGTEASNEKGLIPTLIRQIKTALPQMIVIGDVALDAYTNHGHDGLLDEKGDVENDSTIAMLAKMAVILGKAGCDWVAPSDMMDGRVSAIRKSLDKSGLASVAILSYCAKFNSAFYGPFREAIGSAKTKKYLDKSTYQIHPANAREALRCALRDQFEGADLLMIKPAGAYLDILSRLRASSDLPLLGYQVSGEFSQICAAARLGWLDYERARDESLLAIKRAGADLIISYFAKEFAAKLKSKSKSKSKS